MPVYVALLRGINVGGKRSLPMATTRTAFEAAGCTNVATYIQSGNVVFGHAEKSEAKLSAMLRAALLEASKLEVPVVLRTTSEWAAAIAANPYPTSDAVHCAFVPAAPTAEQLGKLDKIDRQRFLPSDFQVIGRHLYLDLPEGIGRDKLAASALRAFPDATVRNWRTVVKLAEMLAELP
jgi:uncharacterized protein (DUF1697 family)